ncbi:MAG: insulinase family protein [Ignavibacteriae bacterium]|nr:MAG: insulinase family protein [Ignavibacteriota bacterium]
MNYYRILILIFILFMTKTVLSQDEKLDRSKPPAPKPPKDIQFPDYVDTTLAKSGINLLLIENHKVPSVSIRLVFKDAGSYFDGDNYGVSSFTAELLTKGTKTRSALQIADEIDFYGGSISSGSDWDGSYISLSILKKHLDKVIDVLADVVINPVFAEEELNRTKDQRISSIIQNKDDAGALSDKMFNKVIFGSSPYAHPSEGTEESIKNITRADIVDFYQKHYCPNKLILAFVGDITRDEASSIIDEHFSNWKEKCFETELTFQIETFSTDEKSTKNLRKNIQYNSKTIYIVDKPGAVQSNFRIGHVGIERNNPDFIAVSVMNTILGGYFGSRINLNLREKHGFTYGARSGFTARIHPGDFSVDADVRNEVTDTSVRLVKEELNRIVNEEVTNDELQTVKNYLTGIFPLQLETPNAVATRVINLKQYGLPKNYYSTYISNVNKLTKKDILEAAKKYIKPDNLYVVISGNAKTIKDKLTKMGDVEIYDVDGKRISN